MNGLGKDLLPYTLLTSEQHAPCSVGCQTSLVERCCHRRTLPNDIVEGKACLGTNDTAYQLVDALYGAEDDQGAKVASPTIPDWAYCTDDANSTFTSLPDQLLLS